MNTTVTIFESIAFASLLQFKLTSIGSGYDAQISFIPRAALASIHWSGSRLYGLKMDGARHGQYLRWQRREGGAVA